MHAQRSGFLSGAWWGNERLWKVWWLLGVPLAIGIAAMNAVLAGGIGRLNASVFLGAAVVQLGAYAIWCGMAWRCAPNVDAKVWTPTARAVIVLGLLRTVSAVFKEFQGS